jgi:hypothetical protein
VRFLVDTQLPATPAHWLREKGHQADHVLDVNLAQSKDTPIWQYAREQLVHPSFLLVWLEPLSPLIVQQLQQNDRLIEVR